MLVQKCIRMFKKSIKKDVKVTFVVTYNVNKLSFYTNTKDHIDKLAHSNVVLGVLKVILVKRKESFLKE